MARAYLRHPTRHVQKSFEDRVKTVLTDGGWFADPAPWGTPPVSFHDNRITNESRVRVEGSLVAVTFGDSTSDSPQELGGGLIQISYVFLVDVITDRSAVTTAIVDDIRDSISGRRGSPMLALVDYGVTPPAPLVGWSAEMTNVGIQKPDPFEVKRNWTTLGGVIEVTLPADGQYGESP